MSRVKHSEIFRIYKSIEILFPLFSAEGEKLWVPGWDYKNIMGSTELHEDYIFLTENHDHATTDAIWLTKRYDPENHYIQFYKVEPNVKVGIITVECLDVGKEITDVKVTYEYIGLSEEGNQFIDEFTWEVYKEFIREWETLLLNYFRTQT